MTLQNGDKGTLVVWLQEALIKWSLGRGDTLPSLAEARLNADGDYGDKTREAVFNFQSANNLYEDGVAGTKTQAKLGLDLTAFIPNGKDKNVAWLLPEKGKGFTGYNRERNGLDQFGRKDTIDGIIRIGKVCSNSDYPYPLLQIGDISRLYGGKFVGHNSHTNGDCFDMRPVRQDRRLSPVDCRNIDEYDADETQMIVDAIRVIFPRSVILFNDKHLVKTGRTKPYPGHYNHLHIRF